MTIPAGMAADAYDRPPLGYVDSELEEGRWTRYVYRADVTPPNVIIACSPRRWVLYPSDGQSNNLGWGDDYDNRMTVPPAPHRCLTIKGSECGASPTFPRTTALDPSLMTDLIPCREDGQRESFNTGMQQWLWRQDVNAGIDPPVRVCWSSGHGGKSLAELNTDDMLNNSRLAIRKAVEFATLYGAQGTVCYDRGYDQGEGDQRNDQQAYKALFATYRQMFEDYIRRATGQAEPVWHTLRAVCAGSASQGNLGTTIAVTQWQMMWELPRVTVSFCDYFMRGNWGMLGVHFVNRGNDLRGEYKGKAHSIVARKIAQAVERGDDPWALTVRDIRTCLCVVPGSQVRNGNIVTVDLQLPDGATSVVEDTQSRVEATGMGCVKGIKQVSGTGAVSSVAVINPSPGVWRLQVGLTVAEPCTIRGGADAVDITTTTDRSAAWTNFKAPGALTSVVVPGLALDDWLIPFQVDVL